VFLNYLKLFLKYQTLNTNLSYYLSIKANQEFDGSYKNKFQDFLAHLDYIDAALIAFEETHRRLLFSYIKGNFVGLTRPTLHRYENIETLTKLKEILIKHFC